MQRTQATTRIQMLLRAVAALALIMAGLAIAIPPEPAEAAVVRAFTPVFSTQTNGSVVVTGNTMMTCGVVANCAQAQNGTVAASNNNFVMGFVDTDADATTSRSSSAGLTVPSGGRVLYAGLFWGAARAAGTGGSAASGSVNTIKFRAPGAAGYTSLTAGTVDNQTSGNNDYSAYRDVTSIVQAAGAGTYWGADMAAGTGVDRYAGWSLVVAVEDPAAPLRDLTVFSGYATVTNNEVVNTTISGFLAPPSGAVGAKFGGVTYEGDDGITGDYFQVGTTRLADSQSPSANFFDGRVTAGGANLTNRNPASLNNMGIDAKVVDAPGVVPNGATSANVRFATSGDFYYPAALTTQIDLYAPTIRGTKTVTNLSGNTPAKVGDTLEYALTFTNTGDDNATNSVITDPLPPNTTLVPGSLRISAGANTGAKTDAAGDDQGEYVAANRLVRFRVGAGANATAGGTLGTNATTTAVFRVRVDAAAAGTSVANTGILDFRAATIAKDYTYRTEEVLTPVAAQADVSLTKTASPDPVAAGEQITYTLTASNAGPSPATDSVITDTLPDGVTYVSSTPSAGSCTFNAPTLTCPVGSIAVNGNATVSVVVAVPTDASATSVTNVASVASATSDPNTTNNSASASSSVGRRADLALTKTAAPANPRPGQQVVYTLVTTNNGPSRANNVSLTDSVPAGLTLLSATTDRGACTPTGSEVSCSAGQLDPGQTMTVTVTARLASGAGPAALTNTARVSSATQDATPANNQADATVTPGAPQADLVVTKVAATDPIVAGGPVQYLVTVTNSGPSDAAAVTLTDTVPGSLSGVSATPTAGACTVTGGTVDCALGDLRAGGSTRVTIDATLAPGAQGTLVNSAIAGSPTADPSPGNNTGTSTAPVTTSADLSLTKTATPRPVLAGGVATYSIVVTNNGPSVARAVQVVDPVPAPLTFLDATSTGGACTAAGTPVVVTCDGGDLAVGATATVTVRAQVPPAGVGSGIDNTASTSSTTPDPVPGNNTATHTLPTAAQADLVMTKAVSPAIIVAGEGVTYTLTARNDGPSTATGVTITDVVSDRVTGVVANGGSCVAAAGNNVSCTVAALAPGATFVVEVTGTVLANDPTGSLPNNASVTSATPPDPTRSNDTSSATAQVAAAADVAVTKTGPADVVAGTNGQWSIEVTNNGPSDAADVRVTDTLPAGMTFVSASSVPGGVTCTAPGGQVVCPVGTLADGATVTITVTGAVASGVVAGTQLVNTAGVSSTTTDPTPGNNSDDHTTTVDESADVRVAKSVTPAPLTPGGEAVYVVDVTNDGPSDARTVEVTDTLDSAFTVLEATFDGGTCVIAGQQVTCSRALLQNKAVAQVRIRVALAAGRTLPVANTATVTSSIDPTAGNNTVDITTPVVPSADLEVIKVASDAQVAAGEGVTYTLTVINHGPSSASGVNVADALPAGITPATVTTSAGSCAITGQDVSCNLATLAPGQPVTVTITATTAPGAATGARDNTATVTSATNDAIPGNNSSTASVNVVARADLRVTKTAEPATVVPGTAVGWSVLVTQTGPSTARSVTITDTVPAGVNAITATYGAAGTPCTVAGQDITCNLGDVPPGQVAIAINGQLAPNYAPTTLVNSATAQTTTTDPTPGNNTGTATADVVRQVDLEIIKTMTPANPVAGQRVTFTLSAYNNGPSDAINAQFIDQLPSGLTDVVVNRPRLLGQPATAECEQRPPVDPGTADNPAAPTVFCSGPAFRAGLPARVIGSIEATIAPGFTGTLTNTARISSETIDRNAANNESSVSAVIGASADVSITKTVSPESPVPGEPVTWTLTATNGGPSVARDVVVSDDVNDALTGVTAGTGTTPNPCLLDTGNDVECDLDTLAPGASVTITVRGVVPADYTGALDNTATIATTTPDPNTDNNTATEAATTAPAADVSIAKAMSPTVPVPGQPVTWTVTVRNAGPSVARNVVVEDDVNEALMGVTASDPCTVGVDNAVQCGLGALAPGAVVVITITGGLPAGFTGALDNTATVASPTDDTPGNNTATTTSTATPSADVSIVKTADPASPVPGLPVTYTLVVQNSGPSVARNVTVSDNVNDALTGLTASAPCTIAAGNDVSCALGDLAPSGPGSTVTLTITGTLPAGFTGDLSNTATVASPTDTTPGNNTSTTTGTTQPDANVSIVKSASPTSPVPGEDITYSLVVTNSGPSVARAVVVSDDVNAVLTDLTASAPCTIAAGNDVECALGDLPASGPGATVTLVITGRVPADFTGDLSNTATVRSPADSTPDNNTSTVTGTATPTADVSITKAMAPTTPVPGEGVSWTVVVTNNGPSVATDVVVSDDVNDAITGLSATAPCTIAAGNDVTCDLGSLDPGETITLTFAGGLPAAFSGALDNTASVASPTDTTSGNNSATTTSTAAAAADVSITKAMSPASPVPGRDVTWTLVVTNNGPSVAGNVVVSDDVADALDNVTGTAPCTVAAGNEVACELGSLDPGETVTLSITGTLGAGFTGDLDNTATVSSPTDSTPGNNTASSSGTAAPDANVGITKTVTPSNPVPGEGVSWTVVVTNTGPSVARDVVVRDDVNDIVTGLTASAPCTIAVGNDVTCVLGDLPASGPGSTVVITMSADLPADFTGTLSNTATVASPTDSTPDNNSATASPATVPGSDLSIVKTASPAVPVAGEDITYTLSITNAGPSVAQDVVITDVVNGALTNVTASAPCTVGAGNEVSCDVGNVGVTGADATRTITITGRVPADFTGTLSNTGTVSSPTDAVPDNNSDTIGADVEPRADVSITKTATPADPVPGADVTWTVVVTNAGPSLARDVVVADDVSDAITDLTATSGATPNRCEVGAGNDVSCNLDDLPPGESVTITISGGLPAGYTGDLTNTATVSSPTDTTPGNNSSTTNGTADPQANVSINKTATTSSPVPGTDVTWVVVVSNAGPSVARNVAVTDDVNDAITELTATAPCTVAAGNVVSCSLGALEPGETITLTLSGHLPPGFTGALDNTATVTSPTDTTQGNNSSTTNGTADPQANVSINKFATPTVPVPGAAMSWSLVVTNTGPSVARDVVVRDDVNDAITGLTATAPCTVAAGNDVTCLLNDLAPGETVTLTVTGQVPPAFAGALANTATVSSPTDVTPDNNSSTTSGTAEPSADVAISKAVAPAVPVPGQKVTWTVTARNLGPSLARNVVVTDDVNDAITGLTATAPCTITTGNLVSCSLDSLAPGATVTLTLTGTVPESFTGALDNTATIASPTDTTPANNTATATAGTGASADLSITKTLAPAKPVAGGPVTFTLTATNDGPSAARDVVISDTLIAALTDATATITGGGTCQVTGQQVACSTASLASGATAIVTVRATVDPDFTGDVTNVATVGASTPDPDLSDNSASVTEAVGGEGCGNARGARVTICPDLEISKVASVAKADPGDKVAFEITVRNLGPSAATDVSVVDELPSELALVDATVTAGPGSVSTDGDTTTCTIARLAPGESTTIRVATRLTKDAAGTVRNVATATTSDATSPEEESAADVVRVKGTGDTDDGNDPEPTPDPETNDDDGELPDTGLSGALVPLGVLGGFLVAGGLVLVRRSRRS